MKTAQLFFANRTCDDRSPTMRNLFSAFGPSFTGGAVGGAEGGGLLGD